MLPKNRRLTRKLLDEVIASGRIFHSQFLSLRAIKVSARHAPGAHGQNRFAAVAAKKYFKTAVIRNKMRRRTYAALSSNLVLLPVFPASIFHCVLLMKPMALDLDRDNLVAAIRDIFVKSGIIT